VFTRSAILGRLRLTLFLFIFISLTSLDGCGLSGNHYAQVDHALQAGRPGEGLAILEGQEGTYGSRSTVLYLMDKGMLQHLAGRYQESNVSLSKAEELSEALYTRRISAEAAAFLTTDNALPYEGEDFEKVMLNVFMAMNYVQLGLWDEALVEARKVDHKLTVMGDRNHGAMTYTKDPFARYLSGVLYEATGNLSEALVAYRLSFEAFEQSRKLYGTEVPDLLRKDLLRITEALGLLDEYESYRRMFPGVIWQPQAGTRGMAELVFVTYAGRAPLKRDLFIDVPFSPEALAVVLATKVGTRRSSGADSRAAESVLYGLTGHVIRLAVPKFVPRRTAVAGAEAVAGGGNSYYEARLATMEDITAIAVKDLDERVVRTTVKAVARAAWKYAAAEGVRRGIRSAVGKKEGGELAGAIAGALAHMVAIASEEADKRSWGTLPDRIELGRLWVPPGTYEVELRYTGGFGVLEKQVVRGVTVQEGQKRFITTRVME